MSRKLVRFCTRVLQVYPALWTFVVVKGVEPTNNHTERVQAFGGIVAEELFWMP